MGCQAVFLAGVRWAMVVTMGLLVRALLRRTVKGKNLYIVGGKASREVGVK